MLCSTTEIRLMPDWTLLAQLVIFLFILFILNRLIFQPLKKLREKRGAFTSDAAKEARHLVEEANQLDAGRQEVLAMALREAQAERFKRVTETHREFDRIVVEARARAKEIVSASAVSIESEERSIFDDMETKVEDISEDIVSRIAH